MYDIAIAMNIPVIADFGMASIILNILLILFLLTVYGWYQHPPILTILQN
jgi:hypothetical protein